MSSVPQVSYIDAASALVGLTIAEDWRPGVARFLGLAAEMAAVVEAVSLDAAELALAPVYRLPEGSAEQIPPSGPAPEGSLSLPSEELP